MKKLFILLSFAIVPFCSFSQKLAFDTTSSWSTLLVRAKEMKRLIYIDFYTSWCGACKVMDKEVYPDLEVGKKFNSTFVNVKVDAEKGEGVDLAKKYNIMFYPSSVFINPQDESVVFISTGYMTPKEFLEKADTAMIGDVKGHFSEMEKDFQKGRRDFDFLMNYFNEKYLYAQNVSQAVDAFTMTYSMDTFFSRKYRQLSHLRLDIDSKTLGEVVNRIANGRYVESSKYAVKPGSDSIVFHYIRPFFKELLDRSFDVAIEKAKENKNEAHLNTVISYFDKIALSGVQTIRDKKYYSMRFYRHGDDVPKLIDYTTYYLTKVILPNIDKGLEMDSFYNKQRSYPRKIGDFTQKNIAELYGSVKAYTDFVSDATALDAAEKWAEKLVALDDSKKNLTLYAALLRKKGKFNEALIIEKRAIDKGQ